MRRFTGAVLEVGEQRGDRVELEAVDEGDLVAREQAGFCGGHGRFNFGDLDGGVLLFGNEAELVEREVFSAAFRIDL